MLAFNNYMEEQHNMSRGSGCGSQLKLWLGFLMSDRGEARRRSIVSGAAASYSWQQQQPHTGAAL